MAGSGVRLKAHVLALRQSPVARRDRNHVERLFNRLKQTRRIATRYDKTAASFLGFLCLAAAKLWLTHYVNKA